MTEFRAGVSAAFQRSTTYPSADMLGLNILFGRAKVRLELSTGSLALNCPLFTWAASLGASVASTVQTCLTLAETLGWINVALVADTHGRVATTLT